MRVDKFRKSFIQHIIRHISNLSLFNKMFYGIITIVLIIIIVSSSISFLYTSDTYEKQAINNAARLVNNINTGFVDNLDQVNRIIMSLYADNMGTETSFSMQDVLFSEDFTNTLDEYKALRVTRDFFQRLIFLRKDFNSIYIYVSKNKNFSYAVNGVNKLDYDPSQEEWFQKTVAANGKTVIFPPHIPYQLNYNKPVISFSRLLINTEVGNSKNNAVILMDLTQDAINSIVEKVNLGTNTNVLFLNDKGKVVYSRNTKFVQKDLSNEFIGKVMKNEDVNFFINIQNQKFLVACKKSEITGWMLLTLTPYSEVTKDYKKLILIYIVLMIVALVVTISVSYAFSRIIFKPVKRLQKGIARLKEGNFDFQLEKFSDDELGQLIVSFNSMIFTIKTLIKEKYEETIARKDAEFKYLQAQINPHFIYNTLQIISSMAVVKKVPEISKVAKSLAKMLRYSISGKTKEISIKYELENVISYLEIQKLRFKDFINYKLNVDEEVYRFSIIKLVLQPLVENSVTHGIEAKGHMGEIEITARLVGNEVHISIFDNGNGISQNKIDYLLSEMPLAEAGNTELSEVNNHNSVGIVNINQRIKLFYGPEYGLDIRSEEGKWTKVTVRIPARRILEEM